MIKPHYCTDMRMKLLEIFNANSKYICEVESENKLKGIHGPS
jgi:hypothetical protein